MLHLTSYYHNSRNRRMFVLSRGEYFEVLGELFYVPNNYEFDGASIPRIFWTIFAPHGRAFEAGCLHDWLYDTKGESGTFSRKEADIIFLHHMKKDGIHPVQCHLFYWAVRGFALLHWKRHSYPSQI